MVTDPTCTLTCSLRYNLRYNSTILQPSYLLPKPYNIIYISGIRRCLMEEDVIKIIPSSSILAETRRR